MKRGNSPCYYKHSINTHSYPNPLPTHYGKTNQQDSGKNHLAVQVHPKSKQITPKLLINPQTQKSRNNYKQTRDLNKLHQIIQKSTNPLIKKQL